MDHPRPAGAFTLVELLVVLLTIAILIAIAIPNLRGSRVRAEVTRAKVDMRTIAVALEAYADSADAYPRSWDPVYEGDGGTASHNRTPCTLTTPIAYITSLPLDPFPDKSSRLLFYFPPNPTPFDGTEAFGNRFCYWDIESEDEWIEPSGQIPVAQIACGAWMIFSPGPDRRVVTTGSGVNFERRWEFWVAYDPTNGIRSNGNLFRTQRTGDGFDFAAVVPAIISAEALGSSPEARP